MSGTESKLVETFMSRARFDAEATDRPMMRPSRQIFIGFFTVNWPDPLDVSAIGPVSVIA